MTVEDIGIVRQPKIYEEVYAITAQDIPVIDAKQMLQDPENTLAALLALCDSNSKHPLETLRPHHHTGLGFLTFLFFYRFLGYNMLR